MSGQISSSVSAVAVRSRSISSVSNPAFSSSDVDQCSRIERPAGS